VPDVHLSQVAGRPAQERVVSREAGSRWQELDQAAWSAAVAAAAVAAVAAAAAPPAEAAASG
jgi:hypothetical protein